LLEDQRLVLLGVDLDFEVVGRRPRAGTRDDLDRLAGRELPVHAGRRDADALLSSAHAEAMELGAVQELREDPRNLLANDAGAVVGDGDPEAARLARRRWGPAVGDGLQLHDHLREDSGFLAGVEGVADGLCDAAEGRRAGLAAARRDPAERACFCSRSVRFELPGPVETFDLVMGDGAIVRVRRHGRRDGTRMFVSNGNGFAIDGYVPFWGPLAERFDVIAFDMRNHGANPLATSGQDGHTYAQMTLDLERIRREVDARLGPCPTIGVFHSMSARTAMKHAIEIGFRWEALILFDPPNVPSQGHRVWERMDVFERRLADWAMGRQHHFDDPSELDRKSEETRAHSHRVAGAHDELARSVLRRADS